MEGKGRFRESKTQAILPRSVFFFESNCNQSIIATYLFGKCITRSHHHSLVRLQRQ